MTDKEKEGNLTRRRIWITRCSRGYLWIEEEKVGSFGAKVGSRTQNVRDGINGQVHGEEMVGEEAFHVGLYDLFTRIALDAMQTRPSWQASTELRTLTPRLIVVGSRSSITVHGDPGTTNDNHAIPFFNHRNSSSGSGTSLSRPLSPSLGRLALKITPRNTLLARR